MEVRKIDFLIGKTISEISGMCEGSTKVNIRLSDGCEVEMYHDQDCCEFVRLYEVVGDVEDLIGFELKLAEEVTNRKDHPEGYDSEYTESFTWTYYKFATIRGYVDLRWLGESNGYYSESVTIKLKERDL